MTDLLRNHWPVLLGASLALTFVAGALCALAFNRGRRAGYMDQDWNGAWPYMPDNNERHI
jgi:hypothetical protein